MRYVGSIVAIATLAGQSLVVRVVVPHLAARLGEDGLGREQVPHLLRLEDPSLWLHQRDSLPGKHEAGPELRGGQMIVGLIETPNMVERRQADERVSVGFRYPLIPEAIVVVPG